MAKIKYLRTAVLWGALLIIFNASKANDKPLAMAGQEGDALAARAEEIYAQSIFAASRNNAYPPGGE